jgi:hypothetical protein
VRVVTNCLIALAKGVYRSRDFLTVVGDCGEQIKNTTERLSTLTIPLIVLCIILYWAGSWWDDILFDPLYSTRIRRPEYPRERRKERWRPIGRGFFAPLRRFTNRQFPSLRARILNRARATARKKLRRHEGEEFSIYTRSKKLLLHSEDWAREVHPWLELSKTARTFLWPLIVVLFLELLVQGLAAAQLLPIPAARLLMPVSWITSWWAVIIVSAMLAAVTEIYVALRVRHMIAMYGLIESKAFWFTVSSAGGHAMRMVCVGRTTYPEADL